MVSDPHDPASWADSLLDRRVVSALALTLRVSLTATAVCLPIGVWLGAWLARTRSRLRILVEVLVMCPLVIPPVVVGLAVLYGVGWVGIPIAFTWWAAALASAIVALPLLVRSVRSAVETIDARLPLVAATLGASPARVFFTVILPMAWPGVVGGGLLAWARAAGEFGATIVVAGNTPGITQTVPLAIYSAIQSPTGQPIWPLVGAAVAVSVVAVIASEALGRVVRRRADRARRQNT